MISNDAQYNPLGSTEFKNIHITTNNSGRGAIIDIIVNDLGRISSFKIVNSGKG